MLVDRLARMSSPVDLASHTPMMQHYPRMTYKCAWMLEFFR